MSARSAGDVSGALTAESSLAALATTLEARARAAAACVKPVAG